MSQPIEPSQKPTREMPEAEVTGPYTPTTVKQNDVRTSPDDLPEVPGHEIHRLLGRGGMGAVYLARHLQLNRLVAVKMLLFEGAAHTEHAERFYREARAVASLQHRGIVQIHEIGERQGSPYFSMEYLQGGSLQDRIRKHPLSAQQSAEIVATLAQAMDFAHEQGIIHRDLKPANVLLTEEGEPKVADFGLAKQIDDESEQTKPGSVLGTPSYMAPEQTIGIGAPNSSWDVYALGGILYACLTGVAPFQGATVFETLRLVREVEPVAPRERSPSIPLDLETICLKCLRKSPEQRYSSARALAEDLERFLEGKPIVARPVGRVERITKWVRRNPVTASLLSVIFVLLVAGTTVSTIFGLIANKQRDRALEREKDANREREKARKAQVRAEKALGRSLARAFRYKGSLLDNNELDALWELASTESESLRHRFLEVALSSPLHSKQLRHRASLIQRAFLGLEMDRIQSFRKILLSALSNSKADLEIRHAALTLTSYSTIIDDELFQACARCLRELAPEIITQSTELKKLTDAVARLISHSQKPDKSSLVTFMMNRLIDRIQFEKDGTRRRQLFEGMLPLFRVVSPEVAQSSARRIIELIELTQDTRTLDVVGEILHERASDLRPGQLQEIALKALAWMTGSARGTRDQGCQGLLKKLSPLLTAEESDKVLSQIVAKLNREKVARTLHLLLHSIFPLLERATETKAGAVIPEMLRLLEDNKLSGGNRSTPWGLIRIAIKRAPQKELIPIARLIVQRVEQWPTEQLFGVNSVIQSLWKRLQPDGARDLTQRLVEALLKKIAGASNHFLVTRYTSVCAEVSRCLSKENARELANVFMKRTVEDISKGRTIGWNELTPLLSDPQVRRLVSLVLDRLQQTKDRSERFRSVTAIRYLAHRLSRERAEAAAERVMLMIEKTKEPSVVSAFVAAFQGLGIRAGLNKRISSTAALNCAKRLMKRIESETNSGIRSACATALPSFVNRISSESRLPIAQKLLDLIEATQAGIPGPFVQAFKTASKRLPSASVVPLAQKTFLILKRKAVASDRNLVHEILHSLSNRVDKSQVSSMLSEIESQLDQALRFPDNRRYEIRIQLLISSLANFIRIDSTDAVRQRGAEIGGRLIRHLQKTTNSWKQQQLAEGTLSLFFCCSKPMQLETAWTLTDKLAEYTPGSYFHVVVSNGFRSILDRLDTQQLVDVLKAPSCKKSEQGWILNELGERLKTKFHDLKHFCHWAKKHSKLDLTTPTKRWNP